MINMQQRLYIDDAPDNPDFIRDLNIVREHNQQYLSRMGDKFLSEHPNFVAGNQKALQYKLNKMKYDQYYGIGNYIDNNTSTKSTQKEATSQESEKLEKSKHQNAHEKIWSSVISEGKPKMYFPSGLDLKTEYRNFRSKCVAEYPETSYNDSIFQNLFRGEVMNKYGFDVFDKQGVQDYMKRTYKG